MLDLVIRGALRNRLIVAITSITLAVFGTIAALRMPIDVLPALDRPVVTLLAEVPGMAVEEIEQLVARPLEQAVNGAPGVERVRSISGGGVAVVHVEFDWDIDAFRARQIVGEKLALVSLPATAEVAMSPMASLLGQILVVGFVPGESGIDRSELRRVVERDVRPRILSLRGVAQVVVNGARPTELLVTADAERMRAYEVTLLELEAAIARANVSVIGSVMPQGATAPLVSVAGRVREEAQLRQAVVRDHPSRPIRIGDVADVEFGPASLATGDAGIDGRPGVLMVVTKQPQADTRALTERIQRELASVRTSLPAEVVVLDSLFRQADFIDRALENVVAAVRDGGLLVVVVLFLFLLNLRTTAITLTAIPLSLACTAVVFHAFGLGIDTMTLGGIAVAIGTVVDDAIVDVENVYRRLRENRHAGSPRTAFEVVYLASKEIRKPVTYGTLLVTVVYLPLFFLSGIEGRLFAPIGIAYIVSVLASLVVAMTLTPVLCHWLLGGKELRGHDRESALVRGLHGIATRVAEFGIRRASAVLAVLLALFVCALYAASTRGKTFLPAFQEGALQVNLSLPPDASLATSDSFGARLERTLMAVDGVAHVARRSGRGEGDAHIDPITDSECIVVLDPATARSREAILEDVRGRLADEFRGLPTETEQPLAHLLSHLLSGVNAQVAIKISGSDLATLRELARRVEHAIEPIDGIRDLVTERIVEVPQVRVEPRRDALASSGVDVTALARTVSLALGGEMISSLVRDNLAYPIRLQMAPQHRSDLRALGSLLVPTLEGQPMRMGDLADVGLVLTPNEIRRENAMRRIVVKHNVADRALSEVVADVERALEPIRDNLKDQPGYAITLGGQFEAQAAASRTILSLGLVALGAMLFILYLHFRSMRLAWLVLLTRPIAFLGGIGALLATGQSLSIAALVGFIALLGMAVRNAILLVDHATWLAREESAAITPQTIVRATRERIVPVMMTALTSGIGLLPLAIGAEEPGRELLYPVATVVIGGLVTNTLLDFVLMPGLLWHLAADQLAAPSPEAT
ncbi:MAG: efflux RND transporter permease subunit [Planctomycetota bacterium]